MTLSIAVAYAADFDVVNELAKRSGLPVTRLDSLLANCDANQTSMYFCAWRDLIAADHNLETASDQRASSSPACKKAVDRRLHGWTKKRDAICAKTAEEEYGGGSLEQTAQTQCAVSTTQDMIKKIATLHCAG
jgi:uncharacterized protein YecT (DUF1311 family)